MMGSVIIAFILGCAVGLCAYRQGIISVLKRNPTTLCDNCEFCVLTGREPFPPKKEEEKENPA